MAEKIDLSIIIVNYNTRELLKECLASIQNSIRQLADKIQSHEVIVVDNGSTDGSVEFIKELMGSRVKELNNSLINNSLIKNKLRLIENKKNLGFAKAVNQGIKKAEGRYILSLNPDTVVFPDTLPTMIRFMDEHPDVGAATCRVELPDGSLDQASHRGFPTPWNAFCYFSGLAKIFPKSKIFSSYSLTYLPLNKIHEIDSGCGAFLLVRREAGDKVNWLDEDYFWYGEDLDFCYRLKQKEWKIMFVPTTKIIHYKGAASGIKKHSQKVSAADEETKIQAVKASTEVMRIFFQKHYKDKYPKIVYWLVMLGIGLLERIRLVKIR